MTPTEMLEAARARSARQLAEWEEERQRLKREREDVQVAFARDVAPHLRPATPADYSAWLRSWLEHGGAIGHAYDYPMRGVMVALRNFALAPLFGSASVEIIVPSGIVVVCPEPGHSRVYYMDGPRFVAWVQQAHAWSDTEV